jgi:hypothetical protein
VNVHAVGLLGWLIAFGPSCLRSLASYLGPALGAQLGGAALPALPAHLSHGSEDVPLAHGGKHISRIGCHGGNLGLSTRKSKIFQRSGLDKALR